MIRWFVLLFLLVVSLSALSNNEILIRANGFMNSGTKSDKFRAYNDYKNLYLRAIMSENSRYKLSALKGIVKSGKKLNIDISQYEDKLSKLSPSSRYNTPKSNKKIKKDTKIKIKSSHKLKSIRWKNDQLVLRFDKKLRKNQLNYFTLYDPKTSKHRYVFDIHASMLIESQNLRKDGINRIKLAQFDSNTLRLVIENNEKVDIRFKQSSHSISINMKPKSSKKTTKVTSVVPKTTFPQRVDRNKVIVIDAGHGGKDPGAVGYRSFREKIVVFKVAQELQKILKSRGYTVHMTRDRDKFIKLSKRTKFANAKKADIFISIHANAVAKKNANKVHGIECYFLSPSRSNRAEKVAAKENSADLSEMNRYGKNTFLNFLNSHKIVASNKLAIDLQRGMLGSLNKQYKVKDGGVREGPFWVLVGAQMPAVLVEVGFITHPKEAMFLVNSNYRKTMALGLADGVERYFTNN